LPDHATSTSPAVQTQLDRLAALSPGRDTLGLERITALCERLGNPQDRLPPVFHVAGTNGKGSTCAFLRAILEAAGHRVHVYTSPHLVRFNERIRLGGTLISDEDLAATLARVLDVADGLDASFFEITTAAAFLRFSEEPADACVIEVGLGGRLDATNIIKRPLVCGIAALGIDHREFLLAPDPDVPDMPDLERIAFEKAGIAKPGVPLVALADHGPTLDVIDNVIEQVGTPFFPRGDTWSIYPHGPDRMIYRQSCDPESQSEEHIFPRPSLLGDHQIDNAGLAIAMLSLQEAVEVPLEALEEGLKTVRWPARLQRLSPGPLSGDRTIWLDGGHNASAGVQIYLHFFGPDKFSLTNAELDTVEKLAHTDPDAAARLMGLEFMHLIIGMLANKDPDAIAKPLKPFLKSLTVVPVPGHAHHSADVFGEPARAAADVSSALAALPDDGLPVLIAGSLYLAGEVLRLNEEYPD
jgi:dihydrofolate synthase / folylpolyglutamate synthase